MSDRSRRRTRSRIFRMEGLEGRELLSGMHHFGTSAAVHRPPGIAAEFHRPRLPGPSAPVSVMTGRVSGTIASDGLFGGNPPGFLSYSGHGVSRPFGNVLFGMNFPAIPSTTTPGALDIPEGSAEFITSRGGNQLRVVFGGTGTTTARGGQSWTLQGIVLSGTGRFENATGSFQAHGTRVPGRPLARFTLDYAVMFNPSV